MDKIENDMFMHEEDAPLYCGDCLFGKRECISYNDDYDETFVSGQREVVVNDYEETLVRCPYNDKLHHLSDVCIHLDKCEVKEMLLKNCHNCVNHTLLELPVKPKEDVTSTIAMIAQGDNKKEIVFLTKGIAFGIEINFCPICGRELNKES